MTPAAWIALASLAVVVFAHAIASAFLLGKVVQRVTAVEAHTAGGTDQGLAIARLEVKMGHVVKKVDDMDAKMDQRLGFLQEPATYAPRPRRKAPE